MTDVEKEQMADLRSTRAQARKVLKANAWGWVAVLVVGAVATWFQDHRDQERQREICGVMVLLDVPPAPVVGPVTPAVERQQKILAALHRYRMQLGC